MRGAVIYQTNVMVKSRDTLDLGVQRRPGITLVAAGVCYPGYEIINRFARYVFCPLGGDRGKESCLEE